VPEINEYSDITRWMDKLGGTRGHLYNEVLPQIVTEGHDEVKEKVTQNVSGPHYNPGDKKSIEKARPYIGNTPIPRVSIRLAHSIKSLMVQTGFAFKRFYKIWSDGHVAPHNIFVHYGTNKMKARRFIQDAVEQCRPAIFNRMGRAILLEIRRRGLA